MRILIGLIDERRCTAKNKKGRFNYLLTDTDLITTTLGEGDSVTDPTEKMPFEIVLTSAAVLDYTRHYKLVQSREISLEVKKGGKVSISAGDDTGHGVECKMGNASQIRKKATERFVTAYPGDYFMKILDVITFSKKVDCKMYFGKEMPIVVKVGDKMWSLVPAGTTEG